MNPNKYWDINDILMSEELVTCQILKDCSFLTILSPKNEDQDEDEKYIENEDVKLPISIACHLAESEFIAIQAPDCLSEAFFHILQADPTVSDLAKYNYFYEKCFLLMPYIFEEESNDETQMDMKKWRQCLVNTIFQRFLFFFKNSQNVQLLNTNINKHSCLMESNFFEHMVKLNNNIKFFRENYLNNNRILGEKTQAKQNRMKFKKVKGGQIV